MMTEGLEIRVRGCRCTHSEFMVDSSGYEGRFGVQVMRDDRGVARFRPLVGHHQQLAVQHLGGGGYDSGLRVSGSAIWVLG